MAYLDDVLIYTNDIHEEYVQHVHQVLQHLLDHSLYAKFKKYEFHVQETQFLDFIISPDDIAMDPEYIVIIVNWPTLKLIHDIHVFLGFCNFYHQFINSYSHKVLVMTTLLHKISDIFQWTSKA